MKKRISLLLVILLITSIMFGCGQKSVNSGDTNSAEPIKFKFAGNNASSLSTEASKKIAEIIKEKSNGTLIPELYLEGQLGDNDEDLSTAVSEGNVQMLINAEMLFNWAAPEWMELFNMAFVFDNAEQLEKFWKSDTGKDLDKILIDKYNVKAYMDTIALRGPRYVTANKEITSVEDMKGLKMRTPNNPGVVASWKATGANVTPIAWGELFGALQTGIVDAQENPLDNIQQAGLFQVQKYLMQTEHQYTNYFIYLNNPWYESLSEEHKEIIHSAIDEGFKWHNAEVKAHDEELMKEFEEKGMIVITKDKIDIESFKESIIPVVLEKNKDKFPVGGYEKIKGL